MALALAGKPARAVASIQLGPLNRERDMTDYTHLHVVAVEADGSKQDRVTPVSGMKDLVATIEVELRRARNKALEALNEAEEVDDDKKDYASIGRAYCRLLAIGELEERFDADLYDDDVFTDDRDLLDKLFVGRFEELTELDVDGKVTVSIYPSDDTPGDCPEFAAFQEEHKDCSPLHGRVSPAMVNGNPALTVDLTDMLKGLFGGIKKVAEEQEAKADEPGENEVGFKLDPTA